MGRTYVALDLETTGLDPERDAIIEIGAVRFRDGRELETYSTFVNPGRPVPPYITELTGIRSSDVADAPTTRTALAALQSFVGRDPVIGHNIGFDLAFIQRHNVLPGQVAIDTFELASVLVPHAGRYTLENLVRVLALDLPAQTHRALDDARMARALFEALLERAMQLPQEILREIVRLGQWSNWGPTVFFQDASRAKPAAFQSSIGAQLAARRGGDAAGPLFFGPLPPPLTPREETLPLDVEELTRLLDRNGPIARQLSAYEYRNQQLEMMHYVAQAFNEDRHLLVEAGTGTGKSLAYLLPAVLWAVRNQEHVVISTNTINLQEQLMSRDLPLLARSLDESFEAVLLKGRNHYLCRRQLQLLRQRGPASADEMRVLAKVLLWLPNTLDGDGDALFLPTPGERAVWQTLAASKENCDPSRCPFFADDTCFFYRARARAEGAHIILVNHALLLADVAADNRLLPEYSRLIVDEGHHLEAAVTDALSVEVNRWLVRHTVEELLQGTGGAPALLEEVQTQVGAVVKDQEALRFNARLMECVDLADAVGWRLDDIFNALQSYLERQAPPANGYNQRLRLTSALREQDAWQEVARRWEGMRASARQLLEVLGNLHQGLGELTLSVAPELEGLRFRLYTVHERLAGIVTALDAFIRQPTENAIYWLEAERKTEALTVHITPLHVGPLLQEHIWSRKRSVVVTSATLRIGGDFTYLQQRLAARNALTATVGSPFNYRTAALLFIVKDIPEPETPGYQRAVEQVLLRLFEATGGRALALFTSYAQLQSTARAITGPLSRLGITVLAQGSGSSRAQLLDNFRHGQRAVLLGTRSFWEGVDIPGEALSCLVITRLPFDVPNDPVVAARGEQYRDPFNEYMVPEAALRFMQGFGRLIRTQTDRGIVVVLDKRLMTKGYGAHFLRSLPGPSLYQGSMEELPRIAAAWLAGEAPDLTASRPVRSGEDTLPPFEEPPW